MTFGEATRSGFQNYADFRGRATRSEFWWFSLLVAMFRLLLLVPGIVTILGIIALLVSFVPSVSVGARRLHDVGKSGWWLLIALTVIGYVPLIYWWIKDSDPGTNAYGICTRTIEV
jgi:uncharacterized membrane protein YhaH (DUF805 family)